GHEARRAKHGIIHWVDLLGFERVLELDVVDVEVASNGDEDGFAVDPVEHGLVRLPRLHAEGSHEVGDGFLARGADFLKRQRLAGQRRRWREGGLFGVGSVATAGAQEDLVFPRLCKKDEFLAVFPANRTGIRQDGDYGHFDPFKNTLIRTERESVRAVERV